MASLGLLEWLPTSTASLLIISILLHFCLTNQYSIIREINLAFRMNYWRKLSSMFPVHLNLPSFHIRRCYGYYPPLHMFVSITFWCAIKYCERRVWSWVELSLAWSVDSCNATPCEATQVAGLSLPNYPVFIFTLVYLPNLSPGLVTNLSS